MGWGQAIGSIVGAAAGTAVGQPMAGAAIGGGIGGALEGGGDKDKKVKSSTKQQPGPYPEGGQGIWNAWLDQFLGVDYARRSRKYEMNKFLWELTQGEAYDKNKRRDYRWGEQGVHVFNREADKYLTADQLKARDLWQQGALNAVPPDEIEMPTPGVLGAYLSQEEFLGGKHGDYVSSLEKLVKNYETGTLGTQRAYEVALDNAQRKAIPISYGGQYITSVIPQGGINLAEKRRAAQDLTQQRLLTSGMMVPQEQWQFAQQHTPQTGYLQGLAALQAPAMQIQSLRYGIPQTTEQANVPPADQSAGYINLLSSLLAAQGGGGGTAAPQAATLPRTSGTGSWV